MFFTFIEQAFKKFNEVGAIFPSSHFLASRIVALIKPSKKMIIVELGAGTGAFTHKILDKIPPDGKLYSFETNPKMADFLKENIKDSRFKIMNVDAVLFRNQLKQEGIENVDYIISGLPLGNFSFNKRQKILEEIKKCLKNGGFYIQFQYLLVNFRHLKKFFKETSVSFEFLNIPPAFVIKCRKEN